ncbi:hypothetical protein ACWT_2433 [Actinoplanes sp. SE50]|uniref:hypothetical protein n=1 Tax=unclassified Actinoplanes TaxID=2626549 RepID=UPI00023EBD0E|nr:MULTISPECIES: hypothetical protein [unclassified Actinoplanes]AEV83455.1 hypothetical protein ACPL_2560 [Actinoplanes sp. SE50/110]ATO81848.1 hypothetical protein ACWT_2433 [Actinoplanes sp. SE50]SLL99256.1 hypothetical protein ACSP50_2487 [Actinoplanes sp. SE50/110]
MRRAILLFVALIGGLLAGCGSASPKAPAPALPAVTGTHPVGSVQDLQTADSSVRVKVAAAGAAADRYVVRVTVQVLRGTYEFNPVLLHLRDTTGADTGPVPGRSRPATAFTLHPGVTLSWRVPFPHPAAPDAQVVLTSRSGTALAAWNTRPAGTP